MKNLLIASLAFLSLPALAAPPSGFGPDDPLPARIEKLKLKRDDFFHAPRTKLERAFYETGLHHHWQMYQKSETPDRKAFTGYIIFSDPFQRAMKRISFLLGTDCSNFVHRTFQMLGAEFPFAKTRHWIHLGRALSEKKPLADYYHRQNSTTTPMDLRLCEWELLASKFALVEGENYQLGDVVVYPKAEGILGTKGHMGFVSRVQPSVLILQSKYKDGIVELPFEKGERYVLRWKGPMESISGKNLAELLSRAYPESTDRCRDADKPTEIDPDKGP